jgi:hypothetical protein
MGQNDKQHHLLNEVSWGNEPQMGDQQTELDAGQAAEDAFQNVDFLNKLDKKFNELYSDVTRNNAEDLQLFSSKMQKVELSHFAKTVSKKLNPEKDETQAEIDKIMGSSENDILKIFDDISVHSNRKKLYEMYGEIANINSIAFRMLQVYINNILVKNGQTKQFLNVVDNEYNSYVAGIDEEIKENVKKFIKTLLLYFDIQQKIKNKIVPETLKFGDYFVEIVDLSPIENILDNKISILQENIEFAFPETKKRSRKNMVKLAYFEDCTNLNQKSSKELSEDGMFTEAQPDAFNDKLKQLLRHKTEKSFIVEENDLGFWNDVVNEDGYFGEEFQLENFSELDFSSVEDLYLRLIPPSNVLKVEKDGNHYGYLVIEDIEKDNDTNNEIDMYQRFLRDDSDGRVNDTKNFDQEEKLADALVDSISNKLAEIISRDSGFLSDMPDDLRSSLHIIAYEKIRKKSKLKFRFLQADKLINFHTSIDKFRPYGTSIYDPIVLPVKMYTVAMMSSIISRLSRAAVIRKWNVEVGTKRNYPEIIEKVKKDLKTKSISYDNLNSIRNISQVLTDFRDIAVISQNGQRFIDMEIMPMHDRALPMNDMMDLRNELVAATGVPSVYLNVGDAIELRETLVNINIGFSHTVSNLQGFFEDGLNDLLNAIFDIILKKNNLSTDFKLTQFFKITLNHPLVLQLQANESVISTVSNIVGLLTQAGIKFDPITLFERYVPDFNWSDLEKSGESATKKEIKEKLMQGDQQGGY